MGSDIWAFHRASNHPGQGWDPSTAPEPEGDSIALPESLSLCSELGDVLERRASCRQFNGEPLALDSVATLLGASYGCGPAVSVEGVSFASRPVPSAGAKYPLQLHLLARMVSGLPAGSYRFLPDERSLSRSGPGLEFDVLAEMFLRQPYLSSAAAVLVIAGCFAETTARYGDRGYRYVLLEAGHVAQNVVLTSAALGLGSLNLGGFFDDDLATALRLQAGALPLCPVALGSPAGKDREAQRRIRPPTPR
jgi:SagB-type dehydrogenase family enzyme